MDAIPENLSGIVTMTDGTRKVLTHDECKKIYEQCYLEKSNRALKMPTEQDAINIMCEAYQRLIELGWMEASNYPKNGDVFKAIEAGSTGIFDCVYSGEWPTGHYLISDDEDVYCSQPILIKEQLPSTPASPPEPQCPTCGGIADNGHDRENPPNYYECKSCELCATEDTAQPEKVDVEALKRVCDKNGARTVYFSDRGWNACIDHLADNYDFLPKEQK